MTCRNYAMLPMCFNPALFAPVLVLLLSVGVGCTDSSSPKPHQAIVPPAQTRNKIFAVSYPLQFLTQQIAGAEIEVLVPFDDSDDPRRSRPNRATIESMQQSDLVVANGTGASYAKWLTVVSIPESKLVNAASHGLALSDFIPIKGQSIVHAHGPEGEHSHPVMASRTWLDPAMATRQSRYIAEQLKKTYPDRADRFEENLKKLQSRLDELVSQTKTIGEASKQKPAIVLTVGSQFEFLVRATGLVSVKITELSDDKEADLAAIQLQIKQLSSQELNSESNADKPAIVLYDRSKPLPQILAEFFASQKIQTVAIDLLDHAPESGDYLSAMKTNLDRVAKALLR